MSKTANNKTVITAQSVDDFLNSVEDPAQRADSFTLKAMMEDVTGQPATMWGTSIVGFGEVLLRYETGREVPSMWLGFSPRKQNLTIYITDGFDAYSELLANLGKHKTSKSCLMIKRLADVDLAVLRTLIGESAAAMQKMG